MNQMMICFMAFGVLDIKLSGSSLSFELDCVECALECQGFPLIE